MKTLPKTKFHGALCLTVLLLFPVMALAFSGSPPNGRTNAPGEGNCTACHNSFALNAGTGSLTVTDLGNWEPGQDYDLTVTLSDPNASRWGFEFTIIDEAGDSVGSLVNLDSNAQVSSSGNRTYAKHTSPGTYNGTSDQATWTVRWTAPETGTGDVTLYMVGNAANGNSSTSGDYIYAASSSWSEGGVSSVPLPLLAGAELKANYPNPFNPRTNLVYELAQDMSVQLNIYSVDGRLVQRLHTGLQTSGRHEVTWDGMDLNGRSVPSGTYLYRLVTGGVAQTRTMTLVR